MADKEVRIDFTTKGDTKGAKKVEKAIEDVGKSSKEQGRQTAKSGRVSEEALERVEADARRLREQLDKIDGLDPKVKKQILGVADSMDRAAVSGRKLSESKTAVGKSSRNSGLAVLEFSRAVEDAQYGIRGVLNNIPSLVLLLGGGGGLAGVISLAAVGLSQLYERLIKTEKKVEETKDAFEELVEKMAKVKKEASEADYSAFLTSLDRAKEKLDLENARLEANIQLLILKRNAEKEEAEARDALQRTQIDIRRATDPNYTEEDAALDRSKLDLQRLAREAAAKEAEILDRVAEKKRKAQEARQEETLQKDKLLKLLEDEVALEERLADLKSKRAFAGALDKNIEKIRGQLGPAEAGDRLAEVNELLGGSRIGPSSRELEDKLSALLADRAKTGPLEEIESDLLSVEKQLEVTKRRIGSTRNSVAEISAGIDVLDVEAQAEQERAEISIQKIEKIRTLQEQNILKQTELQTTLKGATDIFAKSTLPELESEIKRSGVVLDEGARRAIEQVRELSTNQVADLNERDQLIAALKVLQSRGIDLTGRLITLTEEGLNKQRILEQRLNTMEQKLKALGGRQ